ncbi:hypothetical protein [Sphingobium chungbukense]|uniref:Uncharacterized protein n=1 Tax=Sphingobium chungbukense TaxID=56193 RepID=A0A0M3APX6_9SPHN|nr:hypothetical protein [Sphingobium chungbukense]KKW92227.1 hypothetical protein YP76_09820 [Sphingobium chungbukense]
MRSLNKRECIMGPTAKGLDLANMLIGATRQLQSDDAGSLTKLDRLAHLLRNAKAKLESGFDLSAEEVHQLNEALDKLTQ